MKDGFRRFGGTFQGGDSGNIKVILLGVAALIIFCVIGLVKNEAQYVIYGFLALFASSVFSLIGKDGATSELSSDLCKEYLDEAMASYSSGNFAEARIQFKNAEKYGRIPKELVSTYHEVMKTEEISNN